MKPKLIDIDELARVLDISPDDVRWWVDADLIPGPAIADLWDASAVDEALGSTRLAEILDVDPQLRAELERLARQHDSSLR